MSAKPQTIAIVTGNSNTGDACIKELFARYANPKIKVKGLFRTEEKAKKYREAYPTLEVVTGIDANHPETLKKAFQGVNSALIVTTHNPTSHDLTKDSGLTSAMINAAADAGVKYVVLISSWTMKAHDRIPSISQRFAEPEAHLKRLAADNRMQFTVLRGGYFMENTILLFGESIRKENDIKTFKCWLPLVATRDIGRSAAALLAENKPEHHGKIYELSGPEILSGEQIAAAFTKALGREIKHKEKNRLEIQHLSTAFRELNEYLVDVGKGAVPFTQDVKKLTGQEATTFEQFLKDNLDKFK